MDGNVNKIPYSLILTLLITLTGWGVTFGICQNKIEQNSKDIIRLENLHTADVDRLSTRQASTEQLLQDINKQLVELNTKNDLVT